MDFTNEEKQRIDQLYGNDFKDIMPDDALLIARWEAWKATNEEMHQREMEELKRKTDEQISMLEKKSEEALTLLHELKERAIERFERLDNGQEK